MFCIIKQVRIINLFNLFFSQPQIKRVRCCTSLNKLKTNYLKKNDNHYKTNFDKFLIIKLSELKVSWELSSLN